MSNLVDLQLQIEKLQKQASQIKAKEFHKTVLEIQEKMRAFGITVKDLQSAKRAKSVPAPAQKGGKVKSKKVSGATVAAKYRGPDGQTWTGRGLTPRWMKTLIDSGRTRDEFVIGE